MQIRLDQLAGHLSQAKQRGLRPIYTLFGDEALLAQEAGDQLRAAARAAGHSERQVHTVAGAHFNWSGLLGASQSMSLFGDKQLVDIRIPSGKPGKDGSEALQAYCQHLSEDVFTLVTLPKLDRQQQQSAWFTALDGAGVTVRIDPVERGALPAWIAQRLGAQGQRVQAGEAGQQALAFFADRVEGNLLAAHQEVQKLALLHPPGELMLEQIEGAVLNVARYDVFKLGEAVWAGQVGRALRMLDGLRAEGEAAVLVHWTLAEDIRTLQRLKAAMAGGRRAGQGLETPRLAAGAVGRAEAAGADGVAAHRGGSRRGSARQGGAEKVGIAALMRPGPWRWPWSTRRETHTTCQRNQTAGPRGRVGRGRLGQVPVNGASGATGRAGYRRWWRRARRWRRG